MVTFSGPLSDISDSLFIVEPREFSITTTTAKDWQRFNVANYNSIQKSGYSIVGILDCGSRYVDNAIYVWNYNEDYGLYVNIYWFALVALTFSVRCNIIYKKN